MLAIGIKCGHINPQVLYSALHTEMNHYLSPHTHTHLLFISIYLFSLYPALSAIEVSGQLTRAK